MGVTFCLSTFAWIFFRAKNIAHAFSYVAKIFSSSIFYRPEFIPAPLILLIFAFILIEWLGREQQYAIANLGYKWPKLIRWSFYYIIILAISQSSDSGQQFIYFQF